MLFRSYKVVQDTGLSCNILLTVMTNLCIYYNLKVPLPMSDGVDKYGNVEEGYFGADEWEL